jgi:hypothetical protein
MGRPKQALKGPSFFSFLSFGRGVWGKDFFSFIPGSHFVLFKFSMGSQYFPQVPNVFPNMFSITKRCPPFTYIGGPKGRNAILQNRREPPWFHFVFE